MDASGRVEGDRGYDPSTETDNLTPYYKETAGNDIQDAINKYAEDFARQRESEQEEKKMPTVDFSNAPSWWNKGGDQQNPSSPMTPQQPPAPVQPQQPVAPKAPLMYDILGNVGGRTGITGQQALSSALRAGGESNGQ